MREAEVLSHPGVKIGNRLDIETERVEEYSVYLRLGGCLNQLLCRHVAREDTNTRGIDERGRCIAVR